MVHQKIAWFGIIWNLRKSWQVSNRRLRFK